MHFLLEAGGFPASYVSLPEGNPSKTKLGPFGHLQVPFRLPHGWKLPHSLEQYNDL